MRYHAKVSRDGRWWMVEVPELDVLTQARRVGEAERMAREAIAVTVGAKLDDVEVTVDYSDIGSVTGERLHKYAQHKAALHQLEVDNARESEAIATQLVVSGVPLRDVGELLGVSHQRAHQLVRH